MAPHLDPALFRELIAPLLQARKLSAAAEMLRTAWSPDALLPLLFSADRSVSRHAVMAIGLVGETRHGEALTLMFRSAPDELLAEIEDALWMIWLRGPNEAAGVALHAAIKQREAGDLRGSAASIDRLLAEHPDFSEAHHQRGLTAWTAGDSRLAERCFLRTRELNPWHYVAFASLGHLRVERDDLAGALDYYRASLRLNPRQIELSEIVPRLEDRFGRNSAVA